MIILCNEVWELPLYVFSLENDVHCHDFNNHILNQDPWILIASPELNPASHNHMHWCLMSIFFLQALQDNYIHNEILSFFPQTHFNS